MECDVEELSFAGVGLGMDEASYGILEPSPLATKRRVMDIRRLVDRPYSVRPGFWGGYRIEASLSFLNRVPVILAGRHFDELSSMQSALGRNLSPAQLGALAGILPFLEKPFRQKAQVSVHRAELNWR